MAQMNALSRRYEEDPKEKFIPAKLKDEAPMTEKSQSAQGSLRTGSKNTKTAKGVRFAKSLDIARPPVQEKPSLEAESPVEVKPAPLAEIVQERSDTKPQSITMPKPFQRLSKFKAARMAADVVAQRER